MFCCSSNGLPWGLPRWTALVPETPTNSGRATSFALTDANLHDRLGLGFEGFRPEPG